MTPQGLEAKSSGKKSRAEADGALVDETMAMKVVRRRVIFDGKVLVRFDLASRCCR